MDSSTVNFLQGAISQSDEPTDPSSERFFKEPL